MRQSVKEGLIDPHEQRFTENVFSFGDRRTREIMVPRPEVELVSVAEGPEAAARRARETGHTRFPLVEDGGLDAVIGLLHVKDLLTAPTELRDTDLREVARPLPRISDATLVDEVLRQLRRERQHMALVVDEHGTAVGIVTLEDVLEEIVGEIEDEFDPPGAELIRHDGDGVLIQGAAPLRLVEEELGIELAGAHEATIGGQVVEVLGRVPEPGESVELGGRPLEVLRVAEARVEELRARPATGGGAADGANGANASLSEGSDGSPSA